VGEDGGRVVAARFCEPSSELHIAEDWYRRTAPCDLLLGDEEITKDRLYRGLDHLLAHKTALVLPFADRPALSLYRQEMAIYAAWSSRTSGVRSRSAQRNAAPSSATNSSLDGRASTIAREDKPQCHAGSHARSVARRRDRDIGPGMKTA
jgi:hypothetical protein